MTSLPGVAESTHIVLCAGLEGLAKEVTFAITLASLDLYGIHEFSFNLLFLQKRVQLNAEISIKGFLPDASSATSRAVIGAPINPR